jgi:type IX secretion system substrate protein
MDKRNKIVVTCFLLLAACLNAQTWVTIPDANFVTYLQSTIPSAMSGNQLNTSSTLVTTSTHTINVSNKNIANLDGVQYFTSLTNLSCGTNTLTSLPALPNTLTYLDCDSNILNSLPTLPNSITYLNCSYQVHIATGVPTMTVLPTLPTSLIYLYCGSNNFTSLPALPNTLTYLDCYIGGLTTLPTLPNSLTYLNCSDNFLTSLPALPNSIYFIDCSENSLTSLPTLPISLDTLDCADNSLTNLPTLPNSISFLQCVSNSLTSLPALPNSIKWLDCGGNNLHNLPALPNSLQTLVCFDDSLTSLPTLPASLYNIDCQWNNIICFPYFPSSIMIGAFNISNNPFTCLPNYIAAMGSDTVTYPLCGVGNTNGCPVSYAGIEQFANSMQVNVYPNPFNNQITIENKNQIAITKISVCDLLGREIITFNPEQTEAISINTQGFDKGIYFIKAYNGNSSYTVKLIKE